MRKNTDKVSLLAQGFVLSAFLSEFKINLDANPQQTLKDFYLQFEKKLGVSHIEGANVIFTPGVLLGLLYILIVFPQQKSSLKNPKLKLSYIKEGWGEPEIELWNEHDPSELEVFVRRLRNSISHARIKFDNRMNMTFEDAPFITNKKKKKEKDKIDFRVKFTLEGLEQFTGRLAKEINLDC